MRVLDLFSGIGAFSLGLERSGGFRTVAFCEIDPFCRRVLAKHWPQVPIYEDVRALTAERLRADGIAVDVICGGFPCQDISVAGKGAGIAGERSGLWSEYARIIGELRPRYVIVENVAILLGRGLHRVLGDLAAIGFDAEWHCIPASAVGAPHIRDRIWIVATDAGGDELRHQQQRLPGGWAPGVRHEGQAVARDNGAARAVANPNRRGRREQGHVGEAPRDTRAGQFGDGRADVADTGSIGCGRQSHTRTDRRAASPREAAQERRTAGNGEASGSCDVAIAGGARLPLGPGTLGERAHAATTGAGWWAAEPDVGRVVDGPAARVDRRKRLIALGNAVVPQIPELIGRAILAAQAAE